MSDTAESLVADRMLPDVAAPLITIPGRRPLLDLFPVFFPSEAEAAPQPLPVRPRPQPPPEPLTYEPFYGLQDHPFSVRPDPKFLYHSGAHDRAAQAVLGAIGRRDRLVVVTGEFGFGKTMLCRAIVAQLDRRTLTSFVADPFPSIEGLLKTVLVDFGVVSREHLANGQLRYASQRDLVDALRDFLLSLVKLQASAVVIIDDAQSMSAEILRHLRALVDQAGSGEQGGPDAPPEPVPLLQLILVGQPALLETLGRPALQSSRQGVAVETALGALAPDEVPDYVLHRLAVAGNPHIDFDDAALARVSDLSLGVPRLVNALCDRALEEGHRLSNSVIDQFIVDSAAEALGIGSPPWRAARLWRAFFMGLMFTILALAGAAVAAYVFRDEIAAIVAGP